MTMFRKAMTYLGLGSDDEYDEYGEYDEEPEAAPTRFRVSSRPAGPDIEPTGTVRPIAGRPRERAVDVRDEHRDVDIPAVTIRPRTSTSVRPVHASAKAKPHTVIPRSFNSAQEVADTFKDGQPVIVNLQDVDRDTVAAAHRFRQRALLWVGWLDGEGCERCLPPDTGKR